ncbi:7593ca89-3fd8-40dd-81dd-b37b290a3655 [Thermothielavioides terrestris]|jgi:heme/copper-type cytochrome/quinol oxidase subunit 2
MTSV